MSLQGLHWLPPQADLKLSLAAFDRKEPSVWSTLVQLATTNLDFTATIKLDRALREFTAIHPNAGLPTPPVRLALLSSCTVDHLLPGIRVGGLRRSMCIDTYVPDYGQYAQELSDPNSRLAQFAPTTVLFAFDARHLVGGLNASASEQEVDAFVASAVDHCVAMWTQARKSFACRIIHQLPLPLFPSLLGHNEHRLPGSKAAALARITQQLRSMADRHQVDLLSLDSLVAEQGIDAWHDISFWHKAKHEIRASSMPLYGDHVARLLAAQQGRSYKCLVLDLDNTLWGGVIGDEGLAGIVIGQGSGTGEAFLAVQQYALDLSRRGIILAVCSKNEEANAWLPFDEHPEMLLKRSDIACFIANWEDKATNLRRIAQTLNIGVDALVFLDDNPFERNIVRRELPMVAVPEVPQDTALFVRTLASAGYFESAAITSEDLGRSAQYQAQSERRAASESVTDLDAYLRDLQMELRHRPFDRVGKQRIVQLINKTNQFNLTTHRYTDEEVERLIDDPTSLTMQLRLVDRFGDNGIIAIVIGVPAGPHTLRLDTWLMSCRVLGRSVEKATLNAVVERARQMDIHTLLGEYIPSTRNEMVREHYASLGFTPVPSQEGMWMLDINAFTPFDVPMQVLTPQEITQ